jgi:hypothetical protein
MKSLFVLFAVFLGVSVLSASTPKNASLGSVDWSKAEQQYATNLRSDNAGVVTSAVNYIRKYKLTGAAEELKALLGKDNAENVKMSAALTLVSVCGIEGREAVKSALENEENELIAEFYRSILQSPVAAQ